MALHYRSGLNVARRRQLHAVALSQMNVFVTRECAVRHRQPSFGKPVCRVLLLECQRNMTVLRGKRSSRAHVRFLARVVVQSIIRLKYLLGQFAFHDAVPQVSFGLHTPGASRRIKSFVAYLTSVRGGALLRARRARLLKHDQAIAYDAHADAANKLMGVRGWVLTGTLLVLLQQAPAPTTSAAALIQSVRLHGRVRFAHHHRYCFLITHHLAEHLVPTKDICLRVKCGVFASTGTPIPTATAAACGNRPARRPAALAGERHGSRRRRRTRACA